ncbi:MAG: M1 family aminopeptidase [Cyanobacteria bacterium P01_F01_bin.33]
MDERLFWVEALDTGEKNGKAKHKSFALPGAKPQYAPDRPARVEHIHLAIALDLTAKALEGTCTLHLNPIRSGITFLKLDACGLEVETVRCNGAVQTHDYDGEVLKIRLDTPTEVGQKLEIAIAYVARQPQRGIYFIHPTDAYPDKPVQVWTQGEDEDSRYWFPCFDYPGQLASSEIEVTVPAEFSAISNGQLLEMRDEAGDRKTYHWKQEQVHPTYLMALAVGKFIEIKDEWQGKPVTYYVEPELEAQAKLTMGRTPEMIEFFSETFGYAYPYPKYAQVCVDDFIFGGMENTSVTLLTDRSLIDERAALDYLRAETLVAHELAHQWFGDLLVIQHWSHAWIKEGMATYSEVLWDEHTYGLEHADYHRYQDRSGYISEDSSRYRRPIVTNVYKDAIELYDRHLYEKGACVYHMLRYWLGDELFRAAIHTFVNDNAHSTVETVDLIRAIDKATGLNPRSLFDQYVFRGGHPEFKVAYSWDSDVNLAKVTVTQTQDKDTLFDLKIPIAFGFDEGKDLQTFPVRVSEAEQSFYFPLARKPEFVSFDSGNHHLATVELTYALPDLKAQLLYAPDVMARIFAAKAIAKKGGFEGIQALKTSLQQESFWGVRVEVCQALSEIALERAFDVIADTALKDTAPQVRRTAISVLAKTKTQRSLQAIQPFVDRGDESYFVEAAAASAIGTIAGATVDAAVDVDAAIASLKTVLETKSGWNEIVRGGAISGLAQLKDSDAALELLLQYTATGIPQPLRLAAIRALGSYAADKENAKVLERLRELSRESFFLTQVAVVIALKQLNTTRAIPILKQLDTDDGRVGRMITEAVQTVQKKAGTNPAVKKLREDIDALEKTNRELRDRLEALEAKHEALTEAQKATLA